MTSVSSSGPAPFSQYWRPNLVAGRYKKKGYTKATTYFTEKGLANWQILCGLYPWFQPGELHVSNTMSVLGCSDTELREGSVQKSAFHDELQKFLECFGVAPEGDHFVLPPGTPLFGTAFKGTDGICRMTKSDVVAGLGQWSFHDRVFTPRPEVTRPDYSLLISQVLERPQMIGNSILQTIGTDSIALISYGEFLVNIDDAFSLRQGFETAQRKAKNSENDQCLSRLTGFIYAVTEAPESFDNATVDRVTKIKNCETPGRVHPYRPTTAALAALARLLRGNPGIYGIPNSILVKLERQSEIAAEIVRQDTERQKRIDSSLKISNLLDGSGPTSEAKVQAPVPQQAPLFKSQFADRGVKPIFGVVTESNRYEDSDEDDSHDEVATLRDQNQQLLEALARLSEQVEVLKAQQHVPAPPPSKPRSTMKAIREKLKNSGQKDDNENPEGETSNEDTPTEGSREL